MIKKFLVSMMALIYFYSLSSMAVGSGITYHGRLIDPSGHPVISNNVQFKLQIRTPGNENCLMYEEVQVKDLSQTDGVFSVTINDGSGSRTDTTGLGIDQIFANKGSFTFSAGSCSTGNIYNTSPTDGRKIQVYFNDGMTMSLGYWEPSPAMPINFVPMAIESQQVAGYKAANILRVDTSATVPELSVTQLTELMNLISGTSTKYLNQSAGNSVTLPSYSTVSPPSTPVEGSIWFDSTSKQIKYNDGSTTQVVGNASGAAPTGTAGGILSGTYPNPGLASGVIVDTHISGSAAISDSKLAVISTAGKVSGSAINSGTIAGSTAISTSGNIQTTGSLTAKNLYLYDHTGAGPNSVGLQAPTAITANYVLTFPATAPASNGLVLSSDTLGNLNWVSPAASGSAGGDLSGNFPNPTVTKIQGTAISSVSPTANGQVLRFDGTQWVPNFVAITDLRSSVTGTNQFAASCGANQTLSYNSVGDVMSCSNISLDAILPSQIGNSGKVLTTNGTNAFWGSVTDTLGTLSCSSGDSLYWNGTVWGCRSSSSLNSNNSFVLRDASGNFAANSGAFNMLKVDNGSGSQISIVTPVAFTSWQLRLPSDDGAANQVLQTDGAGNTSWVNVTANPGGSNGQIQFNASGAFAGDNSLNWDNTNKRLGVGTSTPAAKLQVSGEVIVGETSLACSATTKGAIRYNNTTNVLEFCNGTGWNLLQAAACTDPDPAVISFSNEANATTSTLYTSDIKQVTGINCSVPVTISGQGSPQYQICSDSSCSTVVQGWTSNPSSIANNQYLQTRLTSDIAGGATFQATIIIGSGATVWSVTNAGGDCSASPAVGTVCADGAIYAGLSPDGGVKMFTQRCDLGQTWDGVNCTGSRNTLTWNNGTMNWTATGFTSLTTGRTNSSGLAGLSDTGAPYVAAQNCENLNENGKTDWFLPSLSELNVLYSNRLVIRNFNTASGGYWSSTEYNSYNTHLQTFTNGSQSAGNKSNGNYVRCVRR